jgi:hypothetical protein
MSETTTWYEIKGYGIWEVRPIQVVKQTAKTLVIRENNSWTLDDSSRGTRDVRRMLDGNQFDSLEAANAAVVTRYEAKIKYYESEANNYRRHLAKWKEAHQ